MAWETHRSCPSQTLFYILARDKEKQRLRYKRYRKIHRERLIAYCKSWRKANKEKIKARDKAYRKANRERLKASNEAYRKANKEKVKAYIEVYRQTHKKRLKLCLKTYYQNHKEEIVIYKKKWEKDNANKLRDYSRKKRARKRETQVEPINEKIVYLRDGWICQICHKRVDKKLKHPNPMSQTLDHIIPLSKGGTHTYNNVQLAHWRCNISKQNNVLPQGEQLRIF